jgi:hypothetical protein
MVRSSHIKLFSMLVLGGLAVPQASRIAMADQVAREQDIVNLRLGQRVKVDDGTCPAGQVKEVSGAKMSSTGIVRASKCIPRLGPKAN